MTIIDAAGNASTLSSGFQYYVSQFSFVDGGTANGLNDNPAKYGLNPIPIVFNSKLYAAWIESSTNGSSWGGATTECPLRVAVYNGNDSSPAWQFVDNSSLTGVPMAFGIFNSKLYLAYWAYNGSINAIHVSVYNGDDLAPSWTSVDGLNGVLACSGGGSCYLPGSWTPSASFAILNSKLYLGWTQINSARSCSTQMRVAVYGGNDAAPSWTFVDGGLTSGLNLTATDDVGGTVIGTVNGKLYAAWTESNGTQCGAGDVFYPIVAVYNGDDSLPVWTPVTGKSGTNPTFNNVYPSGHGALYSIVQLSMVILNSTVYLAWSSGDYEKGVMVVSYNGSDISPSWSPIVPYTVWGGLCYSTSNYLDSGPQLTGFQSGLYLIWLEGNSSNDFYTYLAAYTGGTSWALLDEGSANGLNFIVPNTLQYGNFNPSSGTSANLIEFNNHLYMVWSESVFGSGTAQIRVKMAQ